MADGIGRIGGGNYGYAGFGPQKKNEDVNQNPATPTPVQNHEETQVDPNKIMDFMANNNFFVAPTKATTSATPVALDAAAEERIAGYMENFEFIYGIVVEEFGEESAPMVMNFVMDYLMDIAA